jgi:hypothetical protein
MNKRKLAKDGNIHSRVARSVYLALLLSICGCAEPPYEPASDTEHGVAGFNIVLEKSLPPNEDGIIESYLVEEDDRVDHVIAHVYDGENLLKEGGPWSWSAGSGTIEGIPAGTGRTVVLLVNDADQQVLYRGEASGIDILAGETADAGTIGCNDFVPTLAFPNDGATVTGNAFENRWGAVTGASEYSLVASENEDFSDPAADIIISEVNYRPIGLPGATTFYWCVSSMDVYGNQSLRSDIWQFTTAADINQLPSANIQSPSNNDAYTPGEEILFSGTGRDEEDGELTGDDLVWRSDLDGQIGIGESFSRDDLSEGTHRITLTATDGDGAPGQVSIEITITGSGAPIANAGADQRVNVKDLVSLDGGASRDPNEDPLTYSWSFTSLPTDSATRLTDPTTQTPSFVADLPGTYVISLVVNDGTQDSDADSVSVIAVERGTYTAFYDFEEGLGDWSADNGIWEVGSPTSGPAAAHSGSNVAGTVLAGDYPNTASRLVSPTIELPTIGVGEELHLRFWQWFSFGNYDEGIVQISRETNPGVWSDWTTLTTYSGASGVWSHALVDLSAYAGMDVRIGFQLSQGIASYVGPGWFVDDVLIETRPTTMLGAGDSYTFDFDQGMGDWSAHNGAWEVGAPHSGPGAAHSGSSAAGTVLAGDYPNTASSLVSPTIELPAIGAGEEIHLRFWQWFSLGNYDEGNVQISRQSAPGIWSDWTTLTTYSGASGVWSHALVDLSAYAGVKVRIGFQLSQGIASYVGPGWFVDDVLIETD